MANNNRDMKGNEAKESAQKEEAKRVEREGRA
jgi:hypothetical protein